MAVYTVSISDTSNFGDVNLGDGSTFASLSVSAGRGPKGDGFTGGTYNASTGIVTFTSNDGIGFSTDDLRSNLSEPGPIGDVTPNTGAFTTLSSTGDTVIGGNLTVEGTTTTVDSTTVSIADKNIELAKDAATAAEADGGGITLNGAAATITYSSANDYWALNKGLNVSGNVSLSGTVDGRDVAADGSKLDGIESNADVTDTANVTAAGALMDSELTSEASVKALDQGVATTDSPEFAGLTATTADINGGTIDGTVIGGSTPAAISGTTGTFSGDLTVDTNTLHVDSANNRVGIGTSSPNADLELGGTGEVLRLSGSSTNAYIRNTDGTTNQWYIGSGGVAGLQHYIYQALPMTFHTAGTERMRIDASGNVGIGTTSAQAKLDVRGDVLNGNSVAESMTFGVVDAGSNYFRSSARGDVYIQASSSVSGAQAQSGGRVYIKGGDSNNGNAGNISLQAGKNLSNNAKAQILFEQGGSEAMRIDSSGNLLVGTTVANGTFAAKGNVATSYTAYLSGSASGSGYNLLCRGATTTGVAVRFLNSAGADVGSIDYTASATSYTTASDYRLKTDAQPMTGASARVQALKPVNFEWVSTGERVDGFLAHEAQEVVPEAVTGTKDAVDADGNPEYQGIDQSKLVPLLTAALQEALQKIEALEARITALEAQP